MSEIKSTRDLIMERTRHLSLSPEEREALRMKEAQERVKALLSHYLNETLSLEEVMSSLSSLPIDQTLIKRIVGREIIDRFDPQAQNDRLLSLFERALHEDISFINERDRTFQEELATLRAQRVQEILAHLAFEGIGGSALIPNLERDASLREAIAERLRHLREDIAAFYQIN